MRNLKEQLSVDVHALLREFKENSTFLTRAWWYPFSSLRQKLELRVFRILFLERYSLARLVFFNVYSSICLFCLKIYRILFRLLMNNF